MTRQVVFRTLIYIMVFVVFTLFFMVLNFPSDKLTDQINSLLLPASNGTLAAGNARVKPLLSLEIGKITLKLDQGSLDLGRAVVRPHILGILRGNRAADVNLENPWLSADMRVVSSGQSLDLDVPDAVVDLAGLPAEIFPVPLKWDGKVQISGGFISKDLSREISSGGIRITSGPITVAGDLLSAVGFAPFKINSVSAIATVENNVVSLGENAIEGDVNATARGVIRLVPPDLRSSQLELTMEIKPDPASLERLKPVFALSGVRTRADGSIKLRIRGTVEKPSVTM